MNINFLRARLSEIGKNQTDLAKALKLDPAGISRAMKGGRQFKDYELSIIADFLQVPLARLLDINEISDSDSYPFTNSPIKKVEKIDLDIDAYTEAIFTAQEALENSGGKAEKDQVMALARRMCDIADKAGTLVITIDLAKWVIDVMRKERE